LFVVFSCTSVPIVAAIDTVAEFTLRLTRVELDAQVEAIYIRHFRDVYRYVLGLTGSHDEADDITAATFERALRAWRSPREVPPAPLPWLLLTARRDAIDKWRRVKRFTALAPRVRNIEATAGERHTEFWMWFESLAGVLSDRQREVLLLRYQRDLTDADVATIMGLSQSGVRSLVARALATLRSHPELL
jgi:RNA polymerase sigma factor (sigma-70 family)